MSAPNVHDSSETMSVVVTCYDGGGIEIQSLNYRPLGLHARFVEAEWCGEVVGGVVAAIVEDWVRRQKADGRIGNLLHG